MRKRVLWSDRIDHLVDNLIGRGPEALEYPLVQLFAVKLLARLGRCEPIYLKRLAEIVVSDALKRGVSHRGVIAAVGEEETTNEEFGEVLVRVPKHYENYDNFVLTFAYHLKFDYKDGIRSQALEELVEDIVTNPERLRALTMAALVCADKLGVGDREIMKEVLRDKLQVRSGLVPHFFQFC